MRSRVVVVVLVSVLVAGALIASYFLERVEVPHSELEPLPPVPLVTPQPSPPRREPLALAPIDAGTPVVTREEPKPRPSQEVDSPAVTVLSAPTSQALRKLCQDAVDTCSQRYSAWFPASLTTELELERKGTGSRVVAAHPANVKNNGPPALFTCIADTLKGGELADLALEADQQMVRCMPRSPKSLTFADGARFRDVLKKCLPAVPDAKLTVEFDVINDKGTLKNGPLTFDGFEPDTYAKRCIEVGLDATVHLPANEAPPGTPRVSLSMSEGGSKVSNSYSFSGPR